MSDFTMDTVQDDIVVLMDYTLTVEGQEIDKGPIEYLQGHGNIIPGLETSIDIIESFLVTDLNGLFVIEGVGVLRGVVP